MRGSYQFRVRSRKTIFEFTIRATSDYVEAKEYESWERYFAQLLISLTRDTPNAYSKSKLNQFYITDKNIRKMEEGFPEPVRNH